MKPTDPQPGSAEHARLRLLMDSQDAQRRARWAAIDARLTRQQAEIDQLLAAERAAAREQVTAEVVAEEQTEEPAIPVPVEGFVPPVAEDLDLLAASSAVGSPAHLRWRCAHVNADHGIFGS